MHLVAHCHDHDHESHPWTDDGCIVSLQADDSTTATGVPHRAHAVPAAIEAFDDTAVYGRAHDTAVLMRWNARRVICAAATRQESCCSGRNRALVTGIASVVALVHRVISPCARRRAAAQSRGKARFAAIRALSLVCSVRQCVQGASVGGAASTRRAVTHGPASHERCGRACKCTR